MLDSNNQNTNSGFKGFNSTGREDTTTEVLRPQMDTAASKRRAMLIALVVVAAAVLGYLAFQRSGLSLLPSDNGGKTFAPGEQRVE